MLNGAGSRNISSSPQQTLLEQIEGANKSLENQQVFATTPKTGNNAI
jgi:hypothetical protein